MDNKQENNRSLPVLVKQSLSADREPWWLTLWLFASVSRKSQVFGHSLHTWCLYLVRVISPSWPLKDGGQSNRYSSGWLTSSCRTALSIVSWVDWSAFSTRSPSSSLLISETCRTSEDQHTEECRYEWFTFGRRIVVFSIKVFKRRINPSDCFSKSGDAVAREQEWNDHRWSRESIEYERVW